MNSLSYILRTLAIISAIIAAVFFFTAKGKLAEKQLELETAQRVTASVQAGLEAANTQIVDLQNNLATERDALAAAKQKLESMRSEMYTAQQEATRTKKQIQQVKGQLADTENTSRLLREELIKAEQNFVTSSREGEIGQLTARVKALTQTNSKLREALKAAQSNNSQP